MNHVHLRPTRQVQRGRLGQESLEPRVVHVAPYRDNRTNRLKFSQERGRAQVSGVNDQIGRGQPGQAVRRESPSTSRHMCVGDDGDVHACPRDIDRTESTCDLVTGAFSYSGAAIASRLLACGRQVRTLTGHPGRATRFGGQVEAHPYRFDDQSALVRSLAGVRTLYNTYWVRFEHAGTTFAQAVANSRMLFEAALQAGVARVVHVSVSNPSLDSPLPYFRGKALVERSLAEVGVAHTIVRPTWIVGGDGELLANNIGWILRRFPVFPIPGDGQYHVQPVHIDDFARICQDGAEVEGNITLDAAGPETPTFEAVVRAIRAAVGSRAPIVHVRPGVMKAAARALGPLVRDVVLTSDEITGLMDGLLVSREAPRGRVAFGDWVAQHGGSLGRSYVNELRNHF